MTAVTNITETSKKNLHSCKYYNNRIKTDPEFYEKEKKRVAEYVHNRYFNDPEYREKILKRKRDAYLRKKNALNNI